MKTRQEMVYEFMIALASAFSVVENPMESSDAEYVCKAAQRLADAYIKHISGN